MSSTLQDLLGRPPTIKPPGRVHRLGDDDERPSEPTKPEVTPFIAATATGDLITAKGEPTMPRGRKAKTITTNPAVTDEAPKKRRGRKPGPKAGRKRKDGAPVGAAQFVIDDRGGMEIRDGQQSIELERADVQRLMLFLDRTKGLRA